MVRTFGHLQRLEGGGVLVLPPQPIAKRVDRVVVRLALAVDAEPLAGINALGMSDPSSFSLDRDEAILGSADQDCLHRRPYSSPNRRGLSSVKVSSNVRSMIASATSRAVTGASSTPLR